jgi:hypothetical protein
MDKSATEIDFESLGSEVELNKVLADRATPDYKGDGIRVKTDVDLRIEQIREGIDTEVKRTPERIPGLSSNLSRSDF